MTKYIFVTGGAGIISSWTTEAQPWRSAVPTQSLPVSPPPTTTTLLSFASMEGSLPDNTARVAAVR